MKKRLVIFLWTWPAVAMIAGMVLIDVGVLPREMAAYLVILFIFFTAQSWMINQLLDN